jgi:adenylate cyclase
MSSGRFPLFLGFALLAIYLFASAPQLLAESTSHGRELSTNALFKILANENDVAREVYTNEIVGAGKKIGLTFAEDWRQPASSAGPLPALFLRNCAEILHDSPHPLGLRLASDQPIESSNKISAADMDAFKMVRRARMPHMPSGVSRGLQVAMFPDIAVSQSCVDCHNEHPKSQKTDWQVDDVMGVTIWTWPSESVSSHEVFVLMSVFRGAVKKTYSEFLAKVQQRTDAPKIGAGWPAEANSLPTPDQFMAKIIRRSSERSLAILLESKR